MEVGSSSLPRSTITPDDLIPNNIIWLNSMRKQVENYFDIASKVAMSKLDKRSFIFGAVGIRNDGRQVRAINSPTEFPNRKAHVEYKLSQKLDKNAVVYIVRIRLLDGNFAMARPCSSCMKLLKGKSVIKAYYTISNYEWGVWDVANNTDTYYTK